VSRIAIFARNHVVHLDAASDIAKTDPSRLVPFRSAKLWTRARKELDQHNLDMLHAKSGDPFSSEGLRSIVEAYKNTL